MQMEEESKQVCDGNEGVRLCDIVTFQFCYGNVSGKSNDHFFLNECFPSIIEIYMCVPTIHILHMARQSTPAKKQINESSEPF